MGESNNITDEEIRHDAKTDKDSAIAVEIQDHIYECIEQIVTIDWIQDEMLKYDEEAYEDFIQSRDYDGFVSAWIEESKFTGIDYQSESEEHLYQNGEHVGQLVVDLYGKMYSETNERIGLELNRIIYKRLEALSMAENNLAHFKELVDGITSEWETTKTKLGSNIKAATL